MAALKLYFALLSEDSPVEISVHRDLTTLQEAWQQAKQSESVGIVHISFIRPKIKNTAALLKHRGNILVTVAAKWVLPDEYHSSFAVIAELKLASKPIPLHLLMKGLGCNVSEPQTTFKGSLTNGVQFKNKFTIAQAARHVLNDAGRPLNKDEIFAHIMEQGLYQFGAKNPVSVLAVELNRYTRGTDYSNPAQKPLFSLLKDGRFLSLDSELIELSSWVKQLSEDQPELALKAGAYGVYGEQGYTELAPSLPSRLRNQLDTYRFKSLKSSIDSENPQALVKILPYCLLIAEIGSFELPVRVLNVLNACNINCLADLAGITISEMMMWPNFGRKSVHDFSEGIIAAVDKLADQLTFDSNMPEGALGCSHDTVTVSENSGEQDEAYQIELASKIPLKEHFEKALEGLQASHRQIIECRTGYNGNVMTLKSVGMQVGVTRERIRQIQKKYVTKIIETQNWDDCIGLKIGQLLIDREAPLYIEMLELEDPWFSGFMGNYQHLAAIIELFSANEIRIIKINGASIVTRINMDDWEQCVSHFRKSLKDKAQERCWTRHDIAMTFKAELSDKGAPELTPLLWGEFDSALLFEGETGDSRLLSFGLSAESVIQAVLEQAEGPLHFTEVAKRATELLGKPVDERRAISALTSQGAQLYGRGIYGLEKFNPISPRMCSNISLIVTNMIYYGPLMRQWHCSEILRALQVKYPTLPKGLDNYILNIILKDSDRLTYLNRMVWVRSDSNQTVNDRIDMADAFTHILEENGRPLKGKEIKSRLSAVRGVSINLQIQPTDRMIQVGPDYWGLIDRDIGGTLEENSKKLDTLYSKLQERQKGIHVSEVYQYVSVCDNSSELPSAYALLNLAQRDSRLYLGRSMYLGLAEWGGDTRRLNISTAVKKLMIEAKAPMSIAEINTRVEDLTEIPIDGTVTNILINIGAIYDQTSRLWHLPKTASIQNE